MEAVKTYQTELVPRDSLKLADYNPRQIDKRMLDQLVRSLTEFGFVQPVIARREDGLVIGGHQRLAALDAIKKSNPSFSDNVPVVYLDSVDDKKAKELNLLLNKVQGTWDYDKLSEVMHDLTEGVDYTIPDLDLAVAGFDSQEVREILDLTAATSDLGEVAPFEQVGSGERVLTFRMPEAVAQEIEDILRRFGADEYPKRAAALLEALRRAVAVAEAAKGQHD